MKKLTTDEFIVRARSKHFNKFGYKQCVYIKSMAKVKITCPKHGIFLETPNDHLAGKGCLKCSYELRAKNKIMTIDKFVVDANKLHGNFFDYSQVIYRSSKSKVAIKCPVHGSFEQIPNHHLQGHGCVRCSGVYSPSTTEFVKNAEKIHGTKYDYSKTVYQSNKQKVVIGCKIHGTFLQTPNGHLCGNGCSRCKESKGEKEITEILTTMKISFIPQFRIKDCKNVRPLPFDFAIFKKDTIAGLVEFNGEQHYKDWSFGGTSASLQSIKKRDAIKKNFCRINKIPLLVIPYWKKNHIENLLTRFIANICL